MPEAMTDGGLANCGAQNVQDDDMTEATNPCSVSCYDEVEALDSRQGAAGSLYMDIRIGDRTFYMFTDEVVKHLPNIYQAVLFYLENGSEEKIDKRVPWVLMPEEEEKHDPLTGWPREVRVKRDHIAFDRIVSHIRGHPLVSLISESEPLFASHLWSEFMVYGNIQMANSLFVLTRMLWKTPIHPAVPEDMAQDTHATLFANSMKLHYDSFGFSAGLPLKFSMLFPVLIVDISGVVQHVQSIHGGRILSEHLDLGGSCWLRGQDLRPWVGGAGVLMRTSPFLTAHPVKVFVPNQVFDDPEPSLLDLVVDAAKRIQLQLCIFSTLFGATTGIGGTTSFSRREQPVFLANSVQDGCQVVTFKIRYYHTTKIVGSIMREFSVCTSLNLSAVLPVCQSFDKLVGNAVNPEEKLAFSLDDRENGRKASSLLEVALPRANCFVERISFSGVEVPCNAINLTAVLRDAEWGRRNIGVGAVGRRH